MTAGLTVFLSDFAGSVGYRVVRDASFQHVAKIATRLSAKVVPLLQAKYASELVDNGQFSAVITSEDLADLVPEGLGLAVAPDPIAAHATLHARACETPGLLWESFETEIGPGCFIADGAVIPERDVRIGRGSVIRHGAVISPRSVIGEGVDIHEYCVVGSAAYEIVIIDGQQVLRPQAGGVRIGDGTQLLPGVAISRTAFGGFTEVGTNTVIDHQCVLSHDAEVGANTRIGGLSWIGGRVRIGNHVTIGPQVTIAKGLTLGDKCNVTLGSVVTRDVGEGARVSGNFAVPHERFLETLRGRS